MSDVRLLPPDPVRSRCAGCGCDMEDHNDPDLGGGCGRCGDCDGFDEYTRDDWDADEGDRIVSENKERGPWDD